MNISEKGNNTRQTTSFFSSRIFYILLLLSALAMAIWQVARITESRSLEILSATGKLRMRLHAGALGDTIEKYRHLPYVLARDARIVSLLKDEIPSLRVNPHLEDFAHTSGALIYVLDRGGTTVATSNWRHHNSLQGHNFSFRPYFVDAQSGKSGGYYAVGLRTGEPGYFLSYPVKSVGEFLGAIVVKVNLESMQETWIESGETVIVSDSSGIIFLTSKEEWKYTSLRVLPESTRASLQALKYVDQPLPELDMQRLNRESYNILQLEDTEYLQLAVNLPLYGWRVHYLSDMQAVERNVRLSLTISTTIASLLFLLLLYLRERRAKLHSLQKAKEASAIKEINEKLLQEIKQHKKTERNLRDTQKELIQAGKLAALGRMSAAIAHELNQPVSAIRTFLASSKVLLQRSRPESVNDNLDAIRSLTERMAAITGQLKTFARKSKGKEEPTELITVCTSLLQVLSQQIMDAGATCTFTRPEGKQVLILGDSLQVEQVLSNLVHNGLDAIRESKEKRIEVTIEIQEKKVYLRVTDSGPGIQEEALESLFDPFFTTKDIGAGLGLGLSISYGIIQEMRGRISAVNLKSGGAQFTVELPLLNQENDND